MADPTNRYCLSCTNGHQIGDCAKCSANDTCDECATGKFLRSDKKLCNPLNCPVGDYESNASKRLCSACSTITPKNCG